MVTNAKTTQIIASGAFYAGGFGELDRSVKEEKRLNFELYWGWGGDGSETTRTQWPLVFFTKGPQTPMAQGIWLVIDEFATKLERKLARKRKHG